MEVMKKASNFFTVIGVIAAVAMTVLSLGGCASTKDVSYDTSYQVPEGVIELKLGYVDAFEQAERIGENLDMIFGKGNYEIAYFRTVKAEKKAGVTPKTVIAGITGALLGGLLGTVMDTYAAKKEAGEVDFGVRAIFLTGLSAGAGTLLFYDNQNGSTPTSFVGVRMLKPSAPSF
jgi:outer membrane lipoprotein SlyB